MCVSVCVVVGGEGKGGEKLKPVLLAQNHSK